jgi:2-C-methyl-D-erythritol 4-phosphate cytidylyltransferase
VAGGLGKRLGSSLPKQFIELKGRPIIFHTIEKFTAAVPGIQVIVVMHPEFMGLWQELCTYHGFKESCVVCAGGEERFFSVANGISWLSQECAVVAVHDAVRPFVSEGTISRCFEAARNSGAAIPVVSLHDSLRQLDGDKSKHLNRSEYRAVQTPQCFDVGLLRQAYRQPYAAEFTDDASVVEAFGTKVVLVDGNRSNIKITTPFDLILAEALMA